MHTGDLVITTREDGYAPRDVIAFRVPEGQPAAGATVIHRITGGNGTDGYVTKGDNRELADDWRPRYADVQGRMWLMVPKGGSAIAFLRSPLAIALAAGIAVFLVIVFDGSTSEKLRRRERGQDDARAAVDDPRTPDPRRSTELRYKL
jgi:signal peptidase